jgi:hypothetical protein
MYNAFPGFVAGVASTARGILQRFEYNLFYGTPRCMSPFEEPVKQGFCISMPVRTSRYTKNFYFHETSLRNALFAIGNQRFSEFLSICFCCRVMFDRAFLIHIIDHQIGNVRIFDIDHMEKALD